MKNSLEVNSVLVLLKVLVEEEKIVVEEEKIVVVEEKKVVEERKVSSGPSCKALNIEFSAKIG